MTLPNRLADCEYGGIEYGGLPVNYCIYVIAMHRNVIHYSSSADKLAHAN